MKAAENSGNGAVVAIIGRPNVGKSTLFNRLVRRRQAIVDDQAGVTRDRQYALAEWDGVPFTIVDTGGFDLFSEDSMAIKIRDQAAAALADADVALFVADAVEGLTPLDEELARTVLARFTGTVLVLANKVDSPARESLALDFYRLGVDKVYPVSAEHAIGLDDVMAAVPRPSRRPGGRPRGEAVPVALVGRPNVGKSSGQRAAREDRVVVDATPGTTRTPSTRFSRGDERWCSSTPRIRRRGRIQADLEKYSAARRTARSARGRLLLVLDATELVTDQDGTSRGDRRGEKACVVVVSSGLVDRARRPATVPAPLAERLKHLSWAPVLWPRR
jgi:GTP-binding protein